MSKTNEENNEKIGFWASLKREYKKGVAQYHERKEAEFWQNHYKVVCPACSETTVLSGTTQEDVCEHCDGGTIEQQREFYSLRNAEWRKMNAKRMQDKPTSGHYRVHCTACDNYTNFPILSAHRKECFYCDGGTDKQKKDFEFYAENSHRGAKEAVERERVESDRQWQERQNKNLIAKHEMCEHCEHKVSPTARSCPSCGHDLIKQRKKNSSWW